MRVTIYHAVVRMFWPFDADRSVLEEVYSYDRAVTTPDHVTFLESIWHENNIIDGTEIPATKGKRSLSVGDVVKVEVDFLNPPAYYAVEKEGWKPVLEADALIAAGRFANYDPFEGL